MKAVSSFQNGLLKQQGNSELGGGHQALLQMEKVMLSLLAAEVHYCVDPGFQLNDSALQQTCSMCYKSLSTKNPFPSTLPSEPLPLLIHSGRLRSFLPLTLTLHATHTPQGLLFFLPPQWGDLTNVK